MAAEPQRDFGRGSTSLPLFPKKYPRCQARFSRIKIAIERLIENGADLCCTPQNVVEFWNVFTRPRERNGFGRTTAEADHETKLIERQFTLLPENERVYPEWRLLVVAYSISGTKVHDARLVAVMKVHAINRLLLTLNASDFARFSGITGRASARGGAGHSIRPDSGLDAVAYSLRSILPAR
jgi:predicted nucleic acid-binding protein